MALAAREHAKFQNLPLGSVNAMLAEKSAVRRMQAAKMLGWIKPATATGRSILLACLNDRSEQVRAAAVDSLGILGGGGDLAARIVPMLRDRFPIVRASAAESLGKIQGGGKAVSAGLCAALSDADSEVRFCAVEALGRKGPAEADTVAKLVVLLKSDPARRVRVSAATALGNVGGSDDPAGAALVEAMLDNSSSEIRSAAAGAIVRGGFVVRLKPGQLAKLQAREGDQYLAVVVAALGDGKPDESRTRAAILWLTDESPLMRSAAARAVGQIGPSAVAAAGLLMAMLRDGSILEQADAAWALGRIGPTKFNAVQMMSEILLKELRQEHQWDESSRDRYGRCLIPDDWPPGNRSLAAPLRRGGVGRFGPIGELDFIWFRMRLVEAIAALDPNTGAVSLIAALGDTNTRAAGVAAKGLSRCSLSDVKSLEAAAAAMSWLPAERKKPVRGVLVRSGRPASQAIVRRVLAGGDPAVLVSVAESIDPNAMSPVVQMLTGRDLLAALDAAHSLSYSRRFGKRAALILADQLSTGGSVARKQARQDLVRLGPAAVDALLILSRGSCPMLRATAMQTLGQIGPAGGKDAEDGLVYALKDHDPGVRRAAARALMSVSKNAAPAAAVLAEDLKSDVPQLRLEALEMLGRIGPGAGDDVARALAQCLGDKHWAVRLAAARALSRIAPVSGSASVVTEALKAATRDTDADVRKAAEIALAAMEKAQP